MMMKNSLHRKIEMIACTHFEKIKLRAFIFAVLKNANDCIIIDMPLNEIKPQISGKLEFCKTDNSLTPCVTSTIP